VLHLLNDLGQVFFAKCHNCCLVPIRWSQA